MRLIGCREVGRRVGQSIDARLWAALVVLGGGLVSAASAQVSPSEDSGGRHLLRYRFRPGDQVHYDVTNRTEIELQQDEAQQQIEHSETTRKHYAVLSTDEAGHSVLELSIDRVQMTAVMDGSEPITFDSARDTQPPALFVGIAETVGRPHVRVQVSSTGKVLSLEWLVGSAAAPQPAPGDAGSLDVFVVLPEEPVAVGDTWKEHFEAEVSVSPTLKKKVKLQRLYRLVGVTDGVAEIELQSTILTPLRDPAEEAQLIQKTPTGTIRFDIEHGQVLARDTTVDRRIVGFSGPKSVIRNQTSRSERRTSEGTDPPSAGSRLTTGESGQLPR
jgi:hypothetical protein